MKISRESEMKFWGFVVAITLLLPVRWAEAMWPFSTETVSWNEDIVLSDKRVLPIQRTVTYGPDQFGRSGRGSLTQQSISFQSKGARIEWTSDEQWPIVYMPDIFDFVDGNPVIVMPVHRFGPCKRYGFPQEGVVGFVLRNNRWETLSAEQLPKELEVNLLRSTHAIQYWPEYKGKRIGQVERESLQGNTWGPRLGDSIKEVTKFYSGIEDSCARIQPLPDPKFDEAKQRSINAQNEAKSIAASIRSRTDAPEQVTPLGFTEAKGAWTGVGYLSPTCKGIVKAIEPLRNYEGIGGWQLIGHQLVTSDGRKVPIAQGGLSKYQAPMQMEQVACDAKTIYAIRRMNKTNLVVHRFSFSGDVIDATRVDLPDTDKVISGNGWGEIWGMALSDGKLSFSIVNYSYPALANLGGTISQKQTYAVTLP